MRRRTFVHIFCSPAYRAGCTTTARLFCDYLTFGNRTFTGFDTDPHDSAFARYFTAQAGVVELGAIQGQIALFDTLLQADTIPKVVDVWSRTWRQFFQLTQDTGFFDEARRRDITPIFYYAAAPGEAALNAANWLHELAPEIMFVVINNEGAAPLGLNALDVLSRYPASHQIEIRALDPIVRDIIDDPDFSFSQFLQAPPRDMSIVIRAGMRAWLGPVFQQFQSFELRQTLQDSRYFG